MAKKPDSFEDVAKEITTTFGKILAVRPYIAIIDALGTIRYTEPQLDSHIAYIQDFIKSNFNLLKVGDHSIPLGGINLAFFKVSEKAIVVIFTQKGFTGQLLAFRSRMHEWSQRIDDLIGEFIAQISSLNMPTETEPAVLESPVSGISRPSGPSGPLGSSRSSGPSGPSGPLGPLGSATVVTQNFKTIPFLTKQLDGKEKFPIDVAHILQFCDGKNSIEEICEKTAYPKIKVGQIIKEYQKKKLIDLKKVLV